METKDLKSVLDDIKMRSRYYAMITFFAIGIFGLAAVVALFLLRGITLYYLVQRWKFWFLAVFSWTVIPLVVLHLTYRKLANEAILELVSKTEEKTGKK